MDRITKSLLDEFSRDYGLSALTEDDRFERFATFVTVHRQYNETFDTADIVFGKKGGMGIDAIAIIVNGSLITDLDSFNELSNAAYLDVTFIFVQADRGVAFEAAKIGNFGFAVLDFFKDSPTLPRSKEMVEAARLMTAIYDKSSKFKRGNPACRMYYVTTGRWTDDQALEARRANVVADLMALRVFRDVSLHRWERTCFKRFSMKARTPYTESSCFRIVHRFQKLRASERLISALWTRLPF